MTLNTEDNVIERLHTVKPAGQELPEANNLSRFSADVNGFAAPDWPVMKALFWPDTVIQRCGLNDSNRWTAATHIAKSDARNGNIPTHPTPNGNAVVYFNRSIAKLELTSDSRTLRIRR